MLGILVSRKQWQSLKSIIADLEHRLEAAEDEIVGRVIEQREGASLRQGEVLRSQAQRELRRRGL